MSVKFVFEDGENTPSSILLKNTYNKNNIFFSNGSSAVLRKACSVQNSGDKVYIFYDVAPNNAKTVNGYNMLVQNIRINNIKNMYVIPIICIEYYICYMFYTYGYLMISDKNSQVYIDNLLINFDWQNLINQVKLNTYQTESLEHMYKSLLAMTKKACQQNSFKYTNGVRDTNSRKGIFYEKDCACDLIYCPIKCRDDILLKAERLYTMLPVFAIESDQHKEYLHNNGIVIRERANSDIKKSRQEFYNNICKSMNVNGIRIVL